MKKSLVLLSSSALGLLLAAQFPQSAEAQQVQYDCSRGEGTGDYCDFVLLPDFQPDPVQGTGISGGGDFTDDCGYIDTPPDHIVTLPKDLPYLRASVDSPGDVTLLVTGPDGRYCRDDNYGFLPVLDGEWPRGEYQIWVGDWDGEGYPYTLQLSELP